MEEGRVTTEANKKLVLQHYESFVDQQDADAVRGQLAADFRDHEMPPGTPPGPEAVLQYRALLAAFSCTPIVRGRSSRSREASPRPITTRP